MPPETIRTLPFGTALVLLRSAPPLVTDLRPWTSRPEAEQLRADRAEVEGRAATGANWGPRPLTCGRPPSRDRTRT